MQKILPLTIGEKMTLSALRRNSNSLAISLADAIDNKKPNSEKMFLLTRLNENNRTLEKLEKMIRERLNLKDKDAMILIEEEAYCNYIERDAA